ncbi:MAG: hypothetical protein MPJ04_04490 [Nitrosopumilus sp.]|nr:hypothetical protein [Nitrosopumilus sp.]
MSDGLARDVDLLLELGVGDTGRLRHIQGMLARNTSLYGTDEAYVDKLSAEYLRRPADDKDTGDVAGPAGKDSMASCRKCGKVTAEDDPSFCSSCGSPLSGAVPVDSTPAKKGGGSGSGLSALFFIGVILSVNAGLAYIIPVTDNNLSIFGFADICNSPIGIIAQSLNSDAEANCAWTNLAVNGLVATGVLGLAVGAASLVLLNTRR